MKRRFILYLLCLFCISTPVHADGPAAAPAGPAPVAPAGGAPAGAGASSPVATGTPSAFAQPGGTGSAIPPGVRQMLMGQTPGSPAGQAAQTGQQPQITGETGAKDKGEPTIAEAISDKGAAGEVKPAETAGVSSIEKALSEDSLTAEKSQPQSFTVGTITQFGYNFFRPEAVGFASLIDIPVGPDYVVGSGDRLVLTLWGSIEGTYELEINRSGEVVLPKVGAVKVAGQTFGQLPTLLKSQLGRIFKDFQLNLNMGKLRLLKVYVVGQVNAPGDYNMSSLATVLNALAAAGGPTKNGTLRNIQIKRNGRLVETVDLYDFFLKGDKSRDIRLQPGDTIYVPAIGPVAGIAGNVRLPAIFELKDEKTLKDLISLADGINPVSYLQRVQISRLIAHEKNIVADFNIDPIKDGKSLDKLTDAIPVQDMDMVKVFPINSTLRGYVRLGGYVLRPGNYALKPGMRIKDILNQDNLLPEFYRETGELTRLFPPDYHPEKILFNPTKALSGDPAANLELQEFDEVKIFSRWEMEEIPKVKVSGEVQKPGEYRLFPRMTIRDLLIQAGNPKNSAYLKTAELRRLDFSGVNIIPSSTYFNLEEVLNGSTASNIELKPFDEVVVKKWFAKEDPPVFISGEVRNPGSYHYVTGMTIRDMVIEAGNTKKTAYLKNAEITRQKIEGNTVKTYPMYVNLEEAIKGDTANNIKLEPFDVVVVRKIPFWTEETERYATIGGEVMFPGSYPVYRGERLSSLIERAGGFTDKAYLMGVKFTREATRQLQQQRMEEALVKAQEDISELQSKIGQTSISTGDAAAAKTSLEGLMRNVELLKAKKAEGRMLIKFSSLADLKGRVEDLELQGGDQLFVPKDQGGVNLVGEVYNQTTVIAHPGRSVDWYMSQVGGANGDANLDEIYVVKVDGTVISQKNSMSLLFFNAFWHKSLDSGDTVVVPRQIEKTAWLRDIKDIATILGQLAITAGVIIATGL